MPDDVTTNLPPSGFSQDSMPTNPPSIEHASDSRSAAAGSVKPSGEPNAGVTAASTQTATAKQPDFAVLQEGVARNSPAGMDRFYDVHVPVWAELGRIELPLGDLLKISEGTVLRLDRPVSDPVDLVSQGVKLARGEVIVIDDCFAIRIKEIIAN